MYIMVTLDSKFQWSNRIVSTTFPRFFLQIAQVKLVKYTGLVCFAPSHDIFVNKCV